MGDPRNVAHAKKVVQEKRHKDRHATTAGAAAPQPAKKAQAEKKKQDLALESAAPMPETEQPAQPPDSTQLAVLIGWDFDFFCSLCARQ